MLETLWCSAARGAVSVLRAPFFSAHLSSSSFSSFDSFLLVETKPRARVRGEGCCSLAGGRVIWRERELEHRVEEQCLLSNPVTLSFSFVAPKTWMAIAPPS